VSWTYEITTGRLYKDDGGLVGVGYSGAGNNKNNANAQSVHNEGPIPEGTYNIGSPVNTVTHGPYVLPLTPDPKNMMWGRFGFLMHGDSVVAPGTASEGCVIMSRDVREAVWGSNDHTLQVVDLLTEA
jgi:hypothetical protein